jgi:hypothetical protein
MREQRVTVRRRFRDHAGTNRAACAGAILDHHWLPPEFGEFPAYNAGEDVSTASRRERNNDLHRLSRVFLSERNDRAPNRRDYETKTND